MSFPQKRVFKPAELGLNADTLNEMITHDKLEYQQLVYRQILATQSSDDDIKFSSNVEKLACWIPTVKQHMLTDSAEQYTSTYQEWIYKPFCGMKLNPMNDPKLREELGSPYLVEQISIDYIKKFMLILQIFEKIGMTFKVDDFEEEIVKPRVKKIDPPKTPLPENIYNAEAPISETPVQANLQTCRRCGAVIDGKEVKGVKKHPFHKLLCEDCKKVADIQYIKFKETGELPEWMQKITHKKELERLQEELKQNE